MDQRKIAFDTYDDVIAEIERLEAVEYEKVGEWSLGQACYHLAYYMRGSLDGFDFKLPWLVRKLIGRPLLHKILKADEMKGSSKTIPASVPTAEIDESAAVADAKALLGRLKEFSGELHPSPLFDYLTIEQWRKLHLGHAARHLGFLVPQAEADG